jgi:hypothetical protein
VGKRLKACVVSAALIHLGLNGAKSLPERVKLPPAPKAPPPPSGIAAGVANVLGTLFGIETLHQRALTAHAAALTQWRETCRELRHQDEKAWQQLKARSALAPSRPRAVGTEASESYARAGSGHAQIIASQIKIYYWKTLTTTIMAWEVDLDFHKQTLPGYAHALGANFALSGRSARRVHFVQGHSF